MMINSPNANLELLHYKGKGGGYSYSSIIILMKSLGKIYILKGSKSKRSEIYLDGLHWVIK